MQESINSSLSNYYITGNWTQCNTIEGVNVQVMKAKCKPDVKFPAQLLLKLYYTQSVLINCTVSITNLGIKNAL